MPAFCSAAASPAALGDCVEDKKYIANMCQNLKRVIVLCVWWVDPGWTLGAHTRSLPSSAGQGDKNTTKGSWVEIRTGTSLGNYDHR